MQINSPLGFLNGLGRKKNEQTPISNQPLASERANTSRAPIDQNAVDVYRRQGFSTAMVLETLTRSMTNQGFPEASMNPVNKEIGEEIKPESLFDFEKVSKDVLKFVGNAIYGAKKGGASDEKLADMLEQARAGVALGFGQAKDELKEANLLNEDLEKGIDKSFELINKGIDNIEEDLFKRVEAPAARAVAYGSNFNTSLSQSSDITITTKEGDKVTLSFSGAQQTHQQESFARIDSGNRAAEDYSMEYSQYSKFSFSYSVEGELNEEEQKAISELVTGISDLQHDFFNGNLDVALEKAKELGFDDSVLQGYTLDLQQTETYNVAQAYKEVERLLPSGNGGNEIAQIVKPLFDYADRFNKLIEQAEQTLASGKTEFTRLFDEILKAGFSEGKVDLQAMQERANHFNDKVKSTEVEQIEPAQTATTLKENENINDSSESTSGNTNSES